MRRFAAMLAFAILLTVVVPPSALAQENVTDGCMNQLLFNGVWRVEVSAVAPFMDGGRQTGWQVTETWRNGTQRPLAPGDALADQTLDLASGSITARGSTSGTLALSSVASNTFAPAGQFTYKQIFVPQSFDASNKPAALLVAFDATKLAQLKEPQFTTARYNMRFKLNCTASAGTGGGARVQGGSTQMAAGEGCMNQWMSNGVWKMRVTKLEPADFGWYVTQEWTNETKRRVFAGTLPSGTSVQTNVGDEYLVTQSGNNASSANSAGDMQQLTVRPFAPGETFSYRQLFTWGQFDKTDTPVRLLVTFDAAKQNAIAHVPHYPRTPNFRINLTCTK